MAVFEGEVIKDIVPSPGGSAGAGSFWKPSDVQEIITNIRMMIREARGIEAGRNESAAAAPFIIDSTPRAAAPGAAPVEHKCKFEAILTDLSFLIDQLVAQGNGDTKILDLLTQKNPTLNNVKQIIDMVKR